MESSRRSDRGSKSPPINSHRNNLNQTRTGKLLQQQNPTQLQQQQQQSPRSLLPEKPLTPYEDRVIPTLRNSNNKSRLEKRNDEDDGQLNNSGSNHSSSDPVVVVGNDSVVPDQQPQQDGEYEQEMYDPMDGTEEMTEREVREAALMNDYLGKQIVRILYRVFQPHTHMSPNRFIYYIFKLYFCIQIKLNQVF